MKKVLSCIIKIKQKVNKILISIFKKINNNKKFILGYGISLLIIYFIAFFPLFRANYNYMDDMIRNIKGTKEWENNSRFTNMILSSVIHADSYLTDISPVTQIIAIIFLVISSLIAIYLLSDDKKFHIFTLFAVIPLGISPYFLECMSYKFDAPYMALSILISVFPLLFYKKKMILYGGCSTVCCIIMCTTYQVSSAIYPMLVLLLSLKMFINKEKSILKFIAVSIISYLIGIFIFKEFIMIPTGASYVSNEIFDLNELIPGVVKNYETYFKCVLEDFKVEWIILILILFSSFLINITLKAERKLTVLLFVISCITLTLMLLFSFGLYPALKLPLFRPRAMYGVGILVAFIGIYSVNYRKNLFAQGSAIILGYMFIIFAVTHGNALAQQKRYTDFRVEMLISDLKDFDIMKYNIQKRVKIIGDIGYTKEITNYTKNTGHNLLIKLLNNPFTSGKMGTYYFLNYFGLGNISLTDFDYQANELILFEDNIYHTIYYKNNYILIRLKKCT